RRKPASTASSTRSSPLATRAQAAERAPLHKLGFVREAVNAPILFDIDGTLVDSTDVVASVWRTVATQHGVDPAAILSVCHGRRDADVVPEFFPTDATATVFRQIAEAETRYAHLLRPLPGAADLLRALHGHPWAAVTSGPRAL